jgi:hypothetical protein
MGEGDYAASPAARAYLKAHSHDDIGLAFLGLIWLDPWVY